MPVKYQREYPQGGLGSWETWAFHGVINDFSLTAFLCLNSHASIDQSTAVNFSHATLAGMPGSRWKRSELSSAEISHGNHLTAKAAISYHPLSGKYHPLQILLKK